MEFATMMELLLSGLAFTVQIFLVTLVGSLPLGRAGGVRSHEPLQAA